MDLMGSRKLHFFFLLLTLLHSAASMRCYVCSWSATLCQDFNCYNNPDVCTNNNFSPTIVRSVECPSGCESFVVTGDTYGQWRDPYQKCYTQYQLGLRITRCQCNDHLCNSSPGSESSTIFILSILSASSLAMILLLVY